MKGKFVTIEGCEGAGKSTQLRFIKEYLENKNEEFIMTREPGGTPLAEKIRELILFYDGESVSPLAEAYLYAAARAQHMQKLIKPALENGKLVICDRFIDSSFAYQAYARNLGFERVSKINEEALSGIMPDLTVFLDIPPEKSFSRKGGADKHDRLEMENKSFHEAVYNGFKILEKKFPERFVSVDVSGTKYETHAKIIEILTAKGIID